LNNVTTKPIPEAICKWPAKIIERPDISDRYFFNTCPTSLGSCRHDKRVTNSCLIGANNPRPKMSVQSRNEYSPPQSGAPLWSSTWGILCKYGGISQNSKLVAILISGNKEETQSKRKVKMSKIVMPKRNAQPELCNAIANGLES